MVREHEVREALALLPDPSWLKHYCYYAERQVDSHLLYHVAVGVTVLSCVCPRTLIGDGPGFKRPTFPNFYAWVVGKSGEAEKTLAMDVGTDLLRLVAPDILAPEPTADTTLAKLLAARGTLLFSYPEGGSFLATTAGANNPLGGALRKGYTRAFDGGTFGIGYSKAEPVTVENPRPSFLGACTPTDLEDYTLGIDWKGGFMSRFFIAYGDKERGHDEPIPMPEMKNWLAGWLECSSREGATADCLGMDAGAKVLWDTWREQVRARYAKEAQDETLSGLLSRARLICAKLAVLITWSTGRAWVGKGQWWVSREEMAAATALTDLHLKAAIALVARIQPSKEMQEQQRLLDAIPIGRWEAQGDAIRVAKLTSKRAAPYFATLLLQGLIEEATQGTTLYYRRVPGGGCRPFDDAFVLPPPPPLPE